MDRLTSKGPNGHWMISGYCAEIVDDGEDKISGPAIDRLAAYEDTGLEPKDVVDLMGSHGMGILDLVDYHELGPIDHLRELVQAENDGRLVVLPCKVGDTCYTIGEEDDEQGPERVMIKGIGALAMGSNSIMFLDPDFIYPTIEAAEAALEAKKNEP